MSKRLGASIRASVLGLVAFGSMTYASAASAACGDTRPHPASWQQEQGSARPNGLLRLASYDRDDRSDDHSIVGMWSVQFFVGTAMIDFGYAQWHSDGTEIMNSGIRPPATQNFCLGVWAQDGPSRYKLNHWALSYDMNGALNGRVNIREEVVVDADADSYSGPFTIDVYDPNTHALVQHVAGRVAGKRITVNTGP